MKTRIKMHLTLIFLTLSSVMFSQESSFYGKDRTIGYNNEWRVPDYYESYLKDNSSPTKKELVEAILESGSDLDMEGKKEYDYGISLYYYSNGYWEFFQEIRYSSLYDVEMDRNKIYFKDGERIAYFLGNIKNSEGKPTEILFKKKKYKAD